MKKTYPPHGFSVPWSVRACYALHGICRFPMALHLLGILTRHPATTLRNLYHLKTTRDDSLPVVWMGVHGRSAFLNYLELIQEQYRQGKLVLKPTLHVFQSYCEKPVDCRCAASPEKLEYHSTVDRRFNAHCIHLISGSESRQPPDAGTTCAGCGIGPMVTRWQWDSDTMDSRVHIMLNEPQVAGYWRQLFEEQVRCGYPQPFLMDVCPMALSLARFGLLQLYAPLGVGFFFDTHHACQSLSQYRRADAGCKDAVTPVALAAEAYTEKETLRQRILSPLTHVQFTCGLPKITDRK